MVCSKHRGTWALGSCSDPTLHALIWLFTQRQLNHLFMFLSHSLPFSLLPPPSFFFPPHFFHFFLSFSGTGNQVFIHARPELHSRATWPGSLLPLWAVTHLSLGSPTQGGLRHSVWTLTITSALEHLSTVAPLVKESAPNPLWKFTLVN